MKNNPRHDTENPIYQAERLAALRETGLLDALPQESLDRYTRIAAMSIGAPVSLVSLIDDHRQFFSSLSGLPEPWASQRETPLSHSFCQLVVQTGEELIVTDAPNDPRVANNLVIPDLGVMAYAGKPIRTSDAHVLGSFCVVDSKPRVWTAHELALLNELCGAVIAEVELRRRVMRSRLSEQALALVNERSADEAKAVARVSQQTVHDLRTPLGIVITGTELLQKHEAARQFPELARTLARVSRNARHAAELLTELERARLAATPPGSVELGNIAAQVAHDLQRAGSHIEYTSQHGGALMISLNETELRRCIENVVSNALRFARQHVGVTTRLRGSYAEVVVDDDGLGLPSAESFTKVWQPGVRYHTHCGLSGSGLGLSIVQEIIERNGGRVEALPSPLGGARFIIALPSRGTKGVDGGVTGEAPAR